MARRRIPPINLKLEEAIVLSRAKEGFGHPPGSEPYMAFESARRKVFDALQTANAKTTEDER